MKFEGNKDFSNLIKVLNKIAAVRYHKETVIPILMQVIDGRENVVVQVATDRNEATVVHPTATECPGNAYIFDITDLNRVVSKLSSTYDVEAKDERLTIKSKRTKYTLKEEGLGEVVPLKPVDWRAGNSAVMPSDDFIQALSVTPTYVAKSDHRQFLCGACVSVNNNSLRISATEGHKLITTKSACKGDGKEWEAIIPLKQVAVIVDLFKGQSGDMWIRLGEGELMKHLNLELNGISYTTTIIEGPYPNVAKLIPEDPPNLIDVDAKDFKDTATTALSISKGLGDDTVHLNISSGVLKIEAANREASSSIQAKTRVLGEVHMKFSGDHLLNSLNLIASQGKDNRVLMYFDDAQHAVKLHSDNQPDQTIVVMPQR